MLAALMEWIDDPPPAVRRAAGPRRDRARRSRRVGRPSTTQLLEQIARAAPRPTCERHDVLSLLLAATTAPWTTRRCATSSHAARRRPRDDGHGARVGARAARPHPPRGRRCAPATRTTSTRSCKETLRLRPVRPARAARMLQAPVEIAGLELPAGRRRGASYLPRCTRAPTSIPTRSRSARSASWRTPAGTYTWIPFGGGVRRCLGASFALFEMKAVLRALAARVERAPDRRAEPTRRRAITLVADPPRPRHRGATSSACAPRATGPDGSLSTELGEPRATLADLASCASRHHPLADRLAREVHGQLGVDEEVLGPVEHVGDAVAGVGDGHHALGAASAPHPRRSGSSAATRRRPARAPSSCRAPSATRPRARSRRPRRASPGGNVLGVRGRGPEEPRRRRSRPASVSTRHARARSSDTTPERSSPASNSTERPGCSTYVSSSNSAIGIAPRISTVTRARNISSRGSVKLERAGQQRARRPRVLMPRVPRPARPLRRAVAAAAQRHEKGVH